MKSSFGCTFYTMLVSNIETNVQHFSRGDIHRLHGQALLQPQAESASSSVPRTVFVPYANRMIRYCVTVNLMNITALDRGNFWKNLLRTRRETVRRAITHCCTKTYLSVKKTTQRQLNNCPSIRQLTKWCFNDQTYIVMGIDAHSTSSLICFIGKSKHELPEHSLQTGSVHSTSHRFSTFCCQLPTETKRMQVSS